MPNYPDDEARYERFTNGYDPREDFDPADIDEDVASAPGTPWRTPADQQCIHGQQAPHRPVRGVCPDEVLDWLGLP